MTMDRTREIVRETQAYYDGAANEIYRDIWGENLHMGMFERAGESLQDAMARANRVLAADAGLTPADRVLDTGCGYGALARYLAGAFGCHVVATNISEVELDWGRELTRRAGLADRVTFEWADFHDLPYGDASFDAYWSQEALLHAADKARALREAYRVLRPGGRIVFTDLLVRRGTPDSVRARIYERVNSPEMWDAPDYVAALGAAGFGPVETRDYARHVAPTYAWVRAELERRRAEFERRIGKELVDRTSQALQFWVDAANDGRIGWACFRAQKPAG